MTNLTDAELALVTTEHDLNPEMNNCWSCDEAWPCPVVRAIAELRDRREYVDILREFIAEVKAENERLRAALVAVRQLCNQSHYVISLSGNGTVPPLSKGRALAMVNTIYRAALASGDAGEAFPATVFITPDGQLQPYGAASGATASLHIDAKLTQGGGQS